MQDCFSEINKYNAPYETTRHIPKQSRLSWWTPKNESKNGSYGVSYWVP